MQRGAYTASAHSPGTGPQTLPEGMVLVPAGSYEMGSLNGGEFEQPVHRVEVDAFWMDSTPVTNRAFAQFAAATGYRTTAEQAGAAWGFRSGGYQMVAGLSWRSYSLPDRQDHPVVLVSWQDAAAFAAWCGKALPTEAQWEKAARGTLESCQYPWGDVAPDGSQCNFAQSASDLPGTREVLAFAPNGYGLFDMVGNVWQWCQDWYAPDYYAASPGTNPEGPSEGEAKVRRGGAWNVLQPFRLRVANRGALPPHTIAPNLGFRCVLSAQLDAAWQQVETVLGALRPAMEADGGGVDIKAIEGGTVLVSLRGSCLHCPSQSLTLKRGLEQSLKAALPWVENVRLSEADDNP